MQNNTHIKQLRKKLNENVPFYSVIVFYGNCRLEDVSFVPSGTFVTKGYRVLDVINTILQNNELANYLDKHHVIDVLKQAVKNGGKIETESQHIENIKRYVGN